MIEALIAGERDPAVLADLARGRMRGKIPDLRLACAGRFGDQHALMCPDAPGAHRPPGGHDRPAGRPGSSESAPVRPAAATVATIPGIGERAARSSSPRSASTCLGSPPRPTWHPGPGCARATTSPPANIGRAGPARATPRSATVLTECAWSAGETGSYVGAQFHRLHRRFGQKGGGKAAIGDRPHPDRDRLARAGRASEYRELGADYFTRRIDSPEAPKRRLIRKLEALGPRHLELTVAAPVTTSSTANPAPAGSLTPASRMPHRSYISVLMSRWPPRGRESLGAGLPARRRRFFGTGGRVSVWRRGPSRVAHCCYEHAGQILRVPPVPSGSPAWRGYAREEE